MNLTPKQEKFAQCIANGMTQADAYRSAFNVKPTTKAETIIASASRLIKSPNISARVKTLQVQLSEKALWTREDSIKALKEAMQIAKDNNQSAGMTAAVKEINAMHGFNAPQKHEITGADGSSLAPTVVVTFNDRD